MVRAGDWEGLIRRLLQEVSLGLDLDYVQRAEAIARLAGHPRSAGVVAALAAEVVGRPDAQFYVDTLGLLRFMEAPRGYAVLIGQLREPTNASSLRACLSVLTTLVRGTGLDPETRLEAVRLAVAPPARPLAPLPRAPRRRQPRAHAGARGPPRRDGCSRPRTVGPRPRSSATVGPSPRRRSARRTCASGASSRRPTGTRPPTSRSSATCCRRRSARRTRRTAPTPSASSCSRRRAGSSAGSTPRPSPTPSRGTTTSRRTRASPC